MPDEERNLEHKRAEYAYGCINEIVESRDEKEKYRSAVLSCGPLIRKAGLIQTMAFYLSKKGPQEKLAEHILKHIFQERNETVNCLFKRLLDSNEDMLMEMTSETQSLVKWLKRFAEARLKKDVDVKVKEKEGTSEQESDGEE